MAVETIFEAVLHRLGWRRMSPAPYQTTASVDEVLTNHLMEIQESLAETIRERDVCRRRLERLDRKVIELQGAQFSFEDWVETARK